MENRCTFTESRLCPEGSCAKPVKGSITSAHIQFHLLFPGFFMSEFFLTLLVVFLDELMSFYSDKSVYIMLDDLLAGSCQAVFAGRENGNIERDHHRLQPEFCQHIGIHIL